MASAFLRSGLRLTSHSRLLYRHRQSLCYSSSIISPSRLLGAGKTPNPTKPSFSAPTGFASFSSKARSSDANLKRVLESEIECAEKDSDSLGQQLDSVLPDSFPFEVIDNPGDQAITLRRVFGNETIEVTVHINVDGEEVQDDEDDTATDDDNKSSVHSDVSLVVKVAKGDGPYLEICCSANPDEILIENLTLSFPGHSPDDETLYEGPVFEDLDENLQKQFYNYLEVRGIKSSLSKYLQEYMIRKDDREYLTWLRSMKEFIEK